MIYITQDVYGKTKLTLDFYPDEITVEFTGDPSLKQFMAYIDGLYEDERIRVYGEYFQTTNLTLILNKDTKYIEVYSDLLDVFEINLMYGFMKLDAGELYQDWWVVKQRDMNEFMIEGNKFIKTINGKIVKKEILKNA